MPAGNVNRPDTEQALKNHEKRIRDLEWTSASAVYVDDRRLAADAATVDFALPATLHLIRLGWFAWCDAAADAIAFLNIDDTFAAVSEDYFWNLSLQNQQGSQGSATNVLTNSGGGLGYVWGDSNGAGWGTVELPNYNGDLSDFGETGPVYTGHGGWAHMNGSTPDTWTVAAYRDGSAPATTLSVSVATVAGVAPASFRAGSRFTLLGF